jgi:hypothetical protein
MARLVLLSGILAMALWSAGARAAEPPPEVCQPPDETLLKARGGYVSRTELPYAEKIEQYNAQVRAFNACSTGAVDSNNEQIERIREAGNAQIAEMAEEANHRIRDIEDKIRRAIAGTALEGAAARDESTSFPAPDCRKPDRKLLDVAASRGRARSTISGSQRYDDMQRRYETCVRTYISQGSVEIKQIVNAANMRIRATADEANGRIAQLRASSRTVIATAEAAAAVEAKMVASTLLNPTNAHGGLPVFDNGVESVTVEGDKMTRSTDTPTGEGNPDAIACRTPQQRADSRIPGPKSASATAYGQR